MNAKKEECLIRFLNFIFLFWVMEIIATLIIGVIPFIISEIELSSAVPLVAFTVVPITIEIPLTETPAITFTPSKTPDVGNIYPEPEDDRNAYNGYRWNNYWIPGLCSFDTQYLRLPRLSIGSAVAYAPEVMEATAVHNGISMIGFVGAVSAEFCSEHGHSVWLKRPNLDWEGPFVVVDCSRRNDLYGQIEFQDQVVEVDFNTAVKWGLMQVGGPGNEGLNNAGRWTALMWRLDGVLLSTVAPDQLAQNEPVTDLSEWFLENVTFANPNDDNWVVYRPPENSSSLPTYLIDGEWVTFP